jgi:biopolymer transport protein TolR
MRRLRGSARGNKRQTLSEINVVPYIDVMLVLVVIFMVTTPLLSQGVKVHLPKANAEPLSVQDQTPVIVTVNVKGEYFLNILGNANATPISSDDLIKDVQEALAKNADRKVYVRGDESASYGEVVGAMVALQQAGVGNVGLMTSPSNHSTNNPANNSVANSGNHFLNPKGKG